MNFIWQCLSYRGPLTGGGLGSHGECFSATAVARRGLFRAGGQTHDELESKFVVATKAVFFAVHN
jgi:hypothetical protein